MVITPGTILCLRTTGELCLVLGRDANEEALYIVRRPIMDHRRGISHTRDLFFDFELETVEEHLRHEASEMVLKAKIQEEMMEEMEATKKGKKADVLVN